MRSTAAGHVPDSGVDFRAGRLLVESLQVDHQHSREPEELHALRCLLQPRHANPHQDRHHPSGFLLSWKSFMHFVTSYNQGNSTSIRRETTHQRWITSTRGSRKSFMHFVASCKIIHLDFSGSQSSGFLPDTDLQPFEVDHFVASCNICTDQVKGFCTTRHSQPLSGQEPPIRRSSPLGFFTGSSPTRQSELQSFRRFLHPGKQSSRFLPYKNRERERER